MLSSIYVQCGEAAIALLADPALRLVFDDGPDGCFTEADVILLAAREGTRGMNRSARKDWMDEAQREASNKLGNMFRHGQVVRFGPVTLPGSDDPDYVRFDGKIVYGNPHGAPTIATANGSFPQMKASDTGVKPRQGRRYGTDRTDFVPWVDQDVAVAPSISLAAEALRERVRDLEAENAILRQRVLAQMS